MFSDALSNIKDYPIKKLNIGTGEDAANKTLELMSEIINKSFQNWRIRELAVNITKDLPARDEYNEVMSIYEWVRNNTRFVRDPRGTELLHSPLVALDKIAMGDKFSGDCDDLSILLASLIKSIGYPIALRIASYKEDKCFSHVYVLVKVKGQWISLDPILPQEYNAHFELPNITRLADIEI